MSPRAIVAPTAAAARSWWTFSDSKPAITMPVSKTVSSVEARLLHRVDGNRHPVLGRDLRGTARPRLLYFRTNEERYRWWRGGGGRNRTHRTGFARPTRVEDEGGHQTSFTSARILSGIKSSEHSQAERDHHEEVATPHRCAGPRRRGRVQGAWRRLTDTARKSDDERAPPGFRSRRVMARRSPLRSDARTGPAIRPSPRTRRCRRDRSARLEAR